MTTREATEQDVLFAAAVLLEKHGEHAAAQGVKACRYRLMSEAGRMPDPENIASWYPTEPEGCTAIGTVTWITQGQVERAALAYLTGWPDD